MRRGFNKYGAVKTEIDGIIFHSKKEARRYSELKLLERAGRISDLKLQVPFQIEISGIDVFKWIADFVYEEDGEAVVEDCKGFRDAVYKLKKRCVEAYYDIEILET